MATFDPLGSTRRIRQGRTFAHVIELSAIHVVVVAGPDRGRHVTLALPSTRIGTGPDNDLILTDDAVSHHHARLERTPEGLVLKDLGSKNGTFVRGVRVREVVLAPDQEFELGETLLRAEPRREEWVGVLSPEEQLGALVGRSPAMREVFALLRAAAGAPATVLLEGESGTGKELAARALHQLSGRRGPLMPFDCGSTSPELIRSELFGHVKGAFSGATEDRAGAFRRAHRGTLFLDEVGDLPTALQPNLLRVLETREVYPVGADEPVPVDVRLVAATNLDLESLVASGRFRTELYHRLRVIRVRMPALRERPEDVPLLVEHFRRTLELTCRIDKNVLDRLAAHAWPGNVRSLRNTLERLGALHGGRDVSPEQLDLPREPAAPRAGLAETEKQAILAALENCGGNQVATARRLGIGLTTLKRKLKEYRS